MQANKKLRPIPLSAMNPSHHQYLIKNESNGKKSIWERPYVSQSWFCVHDIKYTYIVYFIIIISSHIKQNRQTFEHTEPKAEQNQNFFESELSQVEAHEEL